MVGWGCSEVALKTSRNFCGIYSRFCREADEEASVVAWRSGGAGVGIGAREGVRYTSWDLPAISLSIER